MAQIESGKKTFGVEIPMNITIYIDRTINDEEKNFFKSLVQEFLSFKEDKVEVFFDGAGCYEVNLLFHILKEEETIGSNSQDRLSFIINYDEYLGLGLEKITPHESLANDFIKFYDSESFTDNYLRNSSSLRGRHIKI